MPAKTPTVFNREHAAEASPLIERFATEGTATVHGIFDVACNVRELALRMADQESLLSGVGTKMSELHWNETRGHRKGPRVLHYQFTR